MKCEKCGRNIRSDREILFAQGVIIVCCLALVGIGIFAGSYFF